MITDVTYSGTGSQTDFTITFPYLDRDFVEVRVGGVLQSEGANYSFLTPTTIRFGSAPPAGVNNVEFSRQTPTAPLVDFENGAGLDERDLDTATQQAIHLANESATSYDAQFSAVGVVTDGLTNDVSDLDVRVSDNEGDIGTLQGQVSTAQSDITTNEDDISTLQSGLSTAQSDISDNTADIATNAGDISSFQGSLTTNSNRLGAAESRLTVNEADIDTLETTQAAQDVTLGDINLDLASIEDSQAVQNLAIGSFETRLTGLEEGSSASAVAARVVTLEGEMDDVQDDITTLQDENIVTLQNVAALTTTLVIPGAQVDAGHVRIGVTGTLDIETVSNGRVGQLLTLFWRTGGTATAIHADGGSGSLLLADGLDVTPTLGHSITFISNGSDWYETGRTEPRTSQNAAAIAGNAGDITALEGDVAAVEGDITTLQGQVSTANSNISANAGDITALDGDITAVEGDVSTLQGQMTTANSNISDNAGDISTLQGDLTAAEGDITTLQAQSISNTFDVTGLDTFDIPFANTPTTYASIGPSLERYIGEVNSANGDADHVIPLTDGSARSFRVVLDNHIPVTHNVELYLTFSIDGGVTYESSGYQFRMSALDSANGNDATLSNSAAQLQVQRGIPNNVKGGEYTFFVTPALGAQSRNTIRGDGTGFTTFGTDAIQLLEMVGGLKGTTTRVTHLKFAYSSGNIQRMRSHTYSNVQ